MLYFAIVDFPDKATQPTLLSKKGFLNNDEAAIALARIQKDRGDAVVDRLTIPTVMKHLKDWKLWEFGWLYLLNVGSTLLFPGVNSPMLPLIEMLIELEYCDILFRVLFAYYTPE